MALFTLYNLLQGISVSLIIWLIVQFVYNVTYHPLSKIPGSRLAAGTGWYAVYFDFWKGQGGQYVHEIDRQHNVYGPIVRITPREIHIQDEAFREVLYLRGRRVDKDEPYAAIFATPLSLFGTVLHETHRVRRSALNPFFSKASVTRLEPLIQRHGRSLSETMARLGKAGTVIELRHAMIAVTIDIISEYSFGDPVGASLSSESWPKWEAMMAGIAEGVAAAKSFPALYSLLLKMPKSFTRRLSQTLGDYLDYIEVIRRKVRQTLEAHRLEASQPYAVHEDRPDYSLKETPTIFTEVLRSDLPAIEKSEERLTQESLGVISAGSETTSLTLATTLFHMIQHPEVIQKIRDELQTVMPTRHKNADWLQLERLPMLTAAVKEGLRISISICGRLPVVLDEELQYGEYRIPRRTPVSMSPRHSLMNPDIFINPNKYDPERWLDASPAQRALMERAFVPFNQGPRMCPGLNLAIAHMYQALSCILARFDLELVDTTRERDVDLSRDCFVSKPRLESKGIQVRIVKQFEEQW